jgi:hypothetical protein
MSHISSAFPLFSSSFPIFLSFLLDLPSSLLHLPSALVHLPSTLIHLPSSYYIPPPCYFISYIPCFIFILLYTISFLACFISLFPTSCHFSLLHLLSPLLQLYFSSPHFSPSLHFLPSSLLYFLLFWVLHLLFSLFHLAIILPRLPFCTS